MISKFNLQEKERERKKEKEIESVSLVNNINEAIKLHNRRSISWHVCEYSNFNVFKH